MNSITKDAVGLCKIILDNILDSDERPIVNILKGNIQAMQFPTYPSIPTSFCYQYDKTPELLKKEKVFLAISKNLWFERMVDEREEDTEVISFKRDKIMEYLDNNNLIDHEYADYYFDPSDMDIDMGPTVAGQYSVLVDVNRLKRFINLNENLLPIFDKATGELSFLGEKILFSGKVTIDTLDLLILNIGSLVTNEELHNIGNTQEYKTAISKFAKTQVHRVIQDRVDAIKSKLSTCKSIDNAIVIVQKKGYGMFINQKALNSPQ